MLDSDESLMAGVKRRDHQAFATLVQRHTDRFYAGAYRMLGRSEEAEDIVQDAFLKLWNNPSIWKDGKGAKFTTWFYRIVTNLCIDHMRKHKRLTSSEVLDSFESGDVLQDTDLQEREERAHLEEAIQALPDKQKAALNLCFYEEMSNKDAAEILDVNVKALESLLMRAKAGLRDELIRKNILKEKETA